MHPWLLRSTYRVLFCVTLVSGCVGVSPVDDSGPPASARDAGSTSDAAPRADASLPTDAARLDAAVPLDGSAPPDAHPTPDAAPLPDASAPGPDASASDAAPGIDAAPHVDAAVIDATVGTDAARTDAAITRDAAIPDAATIPDATISDATTPDADTPDANSTPDAMVPDVGSPRDAAMAADASNAPDATTPRDAAPEPDANVPDAATTPDAGGPVATQSIRIMAANITSGNYQSYDPGHGIRIFQGLDPDVVLIQEMNYYDNSAAAVRNFVDMAFGTEFFYHRESGAQIPNGVVSRWPIIAAGTWDDPQATNREFVWARVDIPGDVDLWAVSVHLLTANPSTRNSEATQLVQFINTNVPQGDYLVVGGDLNTAAYDEPALTTFSALLDTTVHPADGNGNTFTNSGRTKPYDQVLPDVDLLAHQVPVLIGTQAFPDGLVFDSRVYTPLSDVAPVLVGDSAAPNMQHMAVIKDFQVPVP
ncbi:MAG: endonuclease/exonuclease/phosphatase family protein [Myxococcota bacterium]